ncbi:DUF6036 family nucleotidyltransferase [Duganella radicis]|uniref:DUF6036 domain-containing protein n=1 Tax=Duganella radicis TaxID=551988 RepID=A0A6L6PAZ1_9BURK|nr:DUF6036 family nucleotidyltransferase [Duganella radicis]MTV36080.1 hypothetical protein [Duganella radicis]
MQSFTEAILRLFDDLGDRLAAAGLPSGAVRAYLFGGCAVHMYERNRVSEDLDAEFDYNLIHRDDVLLVLSELPAVAYRSVAGREVGLNIDRRFNTTLCPLHMDYQDRATQLERGQSDASPLTVWLPNPMDVAISKLGRLSVVDVEDILVLLQEPSASWDEFERLATEASQYYVGRNLAGTIAYVKLQWQRRKDNDASSEDVK